MIPITSVERIKCGIPQQGQVCSECGQPLVLVRVWGKDVCRNCYMLRPHRKGHSGMVMGNVKDIERELQQLHISHNKYPVLIRVPKGNKVFSYLFLTHYPKSKDIVGRSICYLVIDNNKVIGIVSGNSPPYSIKAVDEYFGITKENRKKMLRMILNNEVFRLIHTRKNLATQVLKSFRRKIKVDYEEKYGDKLIGIITFVEPPLRGSCYKADNWDYLGKTKGFRVTRRDKMWITKKWSRTIPKLIFAYRYK